MAFLGLYRGNHVNSASLSVEVDQSVGQREKCVVVSHANVTSGMKSRATLAYENVAGPDGLAAVAFYSAALGIGVPSVST